MAKIFFMYLMFRLEYQCNCFYGSEGGGQGQERRDFHLFLATNTDFEIRKIAILPSSLLPNVFHKFFMLS
jgi:hypothetical protein